MKFLVFLVIVFSAFLISCSSSQNGSMFGDFRSTECTGDNCASKAPVVEPSFERDDNSDIMLGKFDNTLEVSGKCRLKELPDSEISIRVTAENGTQRALTDGYVPIVGITSSSNRVAKCEKGRWAIAINACNNLLGAAGVHQIELTLKGRDKNNKFVEIKDGKISMNFIRSANCDVSVQ